jgi:hypothetical protein
MDDVKRTGREAENEAKEQWRKADGDESLEDKAANTADDIRAGLGNLGENSATLIINRNIKDLINKTKNYTV